jgi:hypothetical protein
MLPLQLCFNAVSLEISWVNAVAFSPDDNLASVGFGRQDGQACGMMS